jgi:hypothetical protein
MIEVQDKVLKGLSWDVGKYPTIKSSYYSWELAGRRLQVALHADFHLEL